MKLLIVFCALSLLYFSVRAQDVSQRNHVTDVIGDGAGTTQLRDYNKLHDYNWLENTAIGKVYRSSETEASARMGFYLKNEAQLMEYFATYGKPNHLNKFKKEYAPFYRLAAEATKMPYALSTCVTFRETYFDEDAESNMGARSIAQFLESTYGDLQQAISKNLAIPNCENSFCDDIRRSLATDVREFLNKAKAQGLSIRDYSSEYTSEEIGTTPNKSFPLPPKSFDDFVKDPAWVAIVNQYYLKYNAMRMNSSFNPKGFKKTDQSLLYPMILACTYNAGPTRTNDALKEPNQSLQKLCKRCGSYSTETRNYMLSVRRCMLQYGFDEPTGYEARPEQRTAMASAPQTMDPCSEAYVSVHTWNDSGPPAPERLAPQTPRPRARPQDLVPMSQ